MAAQLVTVAIIPVLSRLYGPAPFGEFAIFVSVTALAAVIGTLRYEMAIVLPRARSEAVAVAQMGIRILAFVSLGITAASVALAIAIAISDEMVQWIWFVLLVGPGIFLLGYNSFMGQWFTRAGEYSRISRNRVMQSVVTAAAQVAFGFVIQGSGIGLVAGLLVGQAAGATFLTLANRAGAQIFAPSGWRRQGYLRRKYWRLPTLLMPHTLVDSFRLNGVNLVIGQYSVAALGQYSQAWRLVQVPAGLIGSAISQVYFPRLAKTPRAEMLTVVRSSVLRTILLGAIPFAMIFWLSPVLFPFILGAEWAEAGKFAQALTPALYVNLVASPISTIFIVLRKEHIGLLFSLSYTLLSLGALFVFRDDLLLAVWIMSACQTLALGIYVALALWLVKPPPAARL